MMNHRTFVPCCAGALGLVLAVGPLLGPLPFAHPILSEAAAQEPPRAPERPRAFAVSASRGWLGIQLSYDAERMRLPGAPLPDDDTRVRVALVAADSPAERAGVRTGDLLVRIDGRPASPVTVQEMTRGLSPGDEVELEVERSGQRQTIRIRAGERPPVFVLGAEGLPVSPDSVRRLVRVHMDSLQLQIDSLRSLGATGILSYREGGVLGTRPSSPSTLFRARPEPPSGVLGVGGAPPRGASTPMAALLVGQRVLAGAEFTALNPALGNYFGVDEGVLTLDVVEGSPAYRGGLRPGDVVLQVGEIPVQSVAELRSELARAFHDPPVHLRILREGSRRTLEIPR